jgi:hypothetical protein
MSILANEILSDTIRLRLLLTRGADSDTIPFTLFRGEIQRLPSE